MNNTPKILPWVCLLALGLRLALISMLPDHLIFPDAHRYHRVATNLLHGQGYVLGAANGPPNYARCMPGYPTFLAGIYWFSGGVPWITRVVQALLSSFTCVLLFWLARCFFSTRVALWAAGWWALEPFAIYFTGLVLTETLAITILVSFMALLLKALDQARPGMAILAGLLLAAASLVKASLALLGVFLLPFLWWRYGKSCYRPLALTLLGFLVGMSPWWYRNYKCLHTFVPLDTRGGLGLYEANNPQADGAPMLDRLVLPPEWLKNRNEVQQDQILRQAAWKMIWQDLGRFRRLAWVKFKRTWGLGLNYHGGRFPWFYQCVAVVSTGALYLMLLLGMLLARRTWRRWLVLLAPALYLTGVHLFFVGSVRYRLPAVPFLVILAAVGLSYVVHAWWVPRRSEEFPPVNFAATKLSVIIPAYNEENSLPQLLAKVMAVNIPKEIIIVDDGSQDGTRAFLQRLTDPQIRVLYHEKNQGKGAAIRTGIQAVQGEVVIIQDADLEYDPEDYYAVITPILAGRYQVCYGSRILGHNRFLYIRYYLGGRLLSFLANLLYGLQITDEPTCYKAFRAEVLCSLPLQCKRFGFCPEVTSLVARRGYTIYEVPISYYPRSHQEGKKLNWRDGLQAIWILLRMRCVRFEK